MRHSITGLCMSGAESDWGFAARILYRALKVWVKSGTEWMSFLTNTAFFKEIFYQQWLVWLGDVERGLLWEWSEWMYNVTFVYVCWTVTILPTRSCLEIIFAISCDRCDWGKMRGVCIREVWLTLNNVQWVYRVVASISSQFGLFGKLSFFWQIS